MTEPYEVWHSENNGLVKSWTKGVPVEDRALMQAMDTASLPFIYKHMALMPDVHLGIGATIGSVIPTDRAIIPAAVGVDIGCGMMAVRTNITAKDLPDNLASLRSLIEAAVPHGQGKWGDNMPFPAKERWLSELGDEFNRMIYKNPELAKCNNRNQLGTLGGGNHFVEVCLDENDDVWIMLHSGSRGVGNRIGTHFISKAMREMERWHIQLPDRDLAYLPEGSEHFDDYVEGVNWAQNYARINRELMMEATLNSLREFFCGGKPVFALDQAVNCHHNYVQKENHFGKNVWITRKGAVSAREGQLGIIPGSMGAKSFIVRGKGNRQSFQSCSHGAGRTMSRTAAKKKYTVEDHIKATEGVECRKDAGVLDETPKAYKDIDAVMAAQADLVDVVHTLKQIVCVKG